MYDDFIFWLRAILILAATFALFVFVVRLDIRAARNRKRHGRAQ